MKKTISKFTQMLEFKAVQAGIRFARVSEANILKKYLQGFLSRSSCIVAMPSVVRINNICPS
ncbi:MAG: hypothetical protein U9Q69_01040 [Nanoarchaeota archaeon]|nr:hypothetical protein [Nanoarchaeota archaeon]